MTLTLPEALETFSAVSNGAEMARLSACFAPKAAVADDEGRAYQGRDAIPSWLQAAQRVPPYPVDPRHEGPSGRGDPVVANVKPSRKRGTVVADILGFYFGSPVSLPPMFTRVGNDVFYWGSRR